MNLRQLRYFCEIVDSGSAAAAAVQLHVAPTALSMQLSQLEEELGGALFDRSRRPMTLTALGRYFHPRAKAMVADMGRLEQEARQVAAGKTGVLAVGYTRSTIFSLLPAAIRGFGKRHPGVKIEMMSLLSEHQHVALRSGGIQVGVSRYLGPVEPVAGLEFRHLMDDPFVVALPAAHRFAKRKALTAKELGAIGLITYPRDPQSTFAAHSVALLRASGCKSPIAQEAEDIHTALGMVASQLGFCLVGSSVSRGSRSDLAFVPIPKLKDRAAVYAVTRREDDSRIVKAFVGALAGVTAEAA